MPGLDLQPTFLARKYWGGKFNGEMKYLMLNHVLQTVDSAIFEVGIDNLRSRRAIEKIGGELFGAQTLDGVLFRISKSETWS